MWRKKNSKKLSDNSKRFSGKDLAIPRKGFSNTLRNYLRVGPTSYEPIAVNVRPLSREVLQPHRVARWAA